MIQVDSSRKEKIPLFRFLTPYKLCLTSCFQYIQGKVGKKYFIRKLAAAVFAIFFVILFVKMRSPSQSSMGICIFDVDGTLFKSESGEPFSYALEAQTRCKSLGYEVAIYRSSKNHVESTKYKGLIQTNFKDIWNNDLLISYALQLNANDGATALRDILDYYNINAKCSIFISNSWANEKDAESAGVAFLAVDINTGLDAPAMTEALDIMQRSCSDTTDYIPPLCLDIPPNADYTCHRQNAWGKCQEPWMQNHCCSSCFDCNTNCTTGFAHSKVVEKRIQ
eukprot:gene7149-14556_t